jgi:CoA-transferase family III
MSSNDGRPLQGHRFGGLTNDWARHLLTSLGATVGLFGVDPADPVARWAESGAMQLSGSPAGPPLVAPGRPAVAADGAIAALVALAPDGALADLDGAAMLAERAALTGQTRQGPWSLGQTCRAVRSSDGWVALNLARVDDVGAVAALLDQDAQPDDAEQAWRLVEREALFHNGSDLVGRATLLGLPLAKVSRPTVTTPWRLRRAGERSGAADRLRPPRVVDLSTLWAGPLAGSLLGRCGAEVIRLESTSRPDGSRSGSPGFDALLHAGQSSVALDFTDAAQLADARRLIASADIVISSARLRALRGLGLDPAPAAGHDRVWLAVSAYGLSDERVGFGDDCAMAGGLFARLDDGRPVPVGDAIADPLTGLHAAVAALACYRAGGSWLVDAALVDAAAAAAGRVHPVRTWFDGASWWVESAGGRARVAAPRLRRVEGSARSLGADTARVMAGVAP